MKIKKAQNTKFKLILLSGVALILFMLSVITTSKQISKPKKDVARKSHDSEITTTLIKKYGILEMLQKEKNIIHKDAELTILYNQFNGVPKLYYVYKDSLNVRQLNDRFFIHVFPKNKNDLLKVQRYNYINMDFSDSKPTEYLINNTTYYVFQREFTHNTLNKFIQIDNIAFFNTGRFKSGLGRSYQISKITFKNIQNKNTLPGLKTLTLELDDPDFQKIKNKRASALKSNVLSKTDNDFVKCYASFENSQKIKSKIRLKGDWTDHLNDEKKWSFRVVLEEEQTIKGMKKFSIQHPKVRNYIWEWLLNKFIKKNELIGLRYDFVNVNIEIKKQEEKKIIPLGLMAFEESFDKRLIENNKRREGIILGFDESHLWNDRKQSFDLNLDINTRNHKIQTGEDLPIRVFEESRVLADPVLNKQFNIAKELLHGLVKKELKISEVFDIDKLTLFVAISNLFGAHHGLISHNLRIYFNPITNKFEPIAFDSDGGYKLDKIANYPFSNNDPLYSSKLLEKLELVSNSSFIKNFIDSSQKELNDVSNLLNSNLEYKTNLWVLDYNSSFIKKQINPATTIISNFIEIKKNKLKAEVTNLSNFPILIEGLNHIDKKKK